MQVRILGAAAGGGLPQWNCRCPNCVAVRSGSAPISARTQSSVAVSADGQHWFLLNASPDIRQQIQDFPELVRPGTGDRGSSVCGCVLTDSEIDHTTGLLLTREGLTFNVYSTALVREWLSTAYPIKRIVAAFAERPWTDLGMGEPVELCDPDGAASGLTVEAFAQDGHAPRFVDDEPEDLTGSVIGLVITDTRTGGRFVYAPCVASLNEELSLAAKDSDLLMIDGTFWRDDEMILLGMGDRTATQMGHLRVGGDEGSLAWLKRLDVERRVYVHINNTNPMLREDGVEADEVRAAGVHIGLDGDRYEL